MRTTLRRFGMVTVLALAACSAGGRDAATVADSAPRSPGADTASAMAGMDHSQMPGMDQPKTDTAGASASNSGASTTAGVDHSSMDMGGRSGAAGTSGTKQPAMAGMDHSQMPMGGTSKSPTSGARAPASGNTAGMDHSRMPMGGSGTAAARRTPAAGSAATGGMAGMDHSRMPMGTIAGQSAPAPPIVKDSGDEKLQRLIAALVKDSLVRRRIQADSALRRRWADTSVRRILIAPP